MAMNRRLVVMGGGVPDGGGYDSAQNGCVMLIAAGLHESGHFLLLSIVLAGAA